MHNLQGFQINLMILFSLACLETYQNCLYRVDGNMWRNNIKGRILKEIKLNKSSGNDGLSVELYVRFLPVIGDVVIGALNQAFIEEELSSLQKQAVITLIEKDGKDPLQIKIIDQYRY